MCYNVKLLRVVLATVVGYTLWILAGVMAAKKIKAQELEDEPITLPFMADLLVNMGFEPSKYSTFNINTTGALLVVAQFFILFFCQ